MNYNYVPADLDRHLLAMKGWGLISEQSEQKRLCDVFISRFKKGPYVVHIQESPYNVVLSVVDESLRGGANTDHQKFATALAGLVFKEQLNPDHKSDLQVLENVSKETKITRLVWLTKSVGTTDSSGKKCADLSKAEENGAITVQAETDGRFVRFEVIKYAGGPAMYLDPYVERFNLSQ
jgi:hypothetical protein